MRVALGGVFNSGILATGVREGQVARFNYAAAPEVWMERVRAIEVVCAQFQVPLRAAALQFPLAHPAVDVVLAGAQTLAHWQNAVAMVGFEIPAEFWAALRAQRLIPDPAPTPLPRHA